MTLQQSHTINEEKYYILYAHSETKFWFHYGHIFFVLLDKKFLWMSRILFSFLSFQQRVIRPFFLLKTLTQKVPSYGHLRVDFQQC